MSHCQHSTASTLILNDTILALNNKKHCAAPLIDFSKALDMVDHALLLQKLHNIYSIYFDEVTL